MRPHQQERTPASKSLGYVNESLFPRLGEALWSWKLCPECLSSKTCIANTCPSRRTTQLGRYFQFYRAMVSTYVDGSPAEGRVLETHDDLWHAISTLKENPDITRAEFYQLLQSKLAKKTYSGPELLKATTFVVKLLTMIDCSALYLSSDRLEKGSYRIHWSDDIPFTKYFQDIFPLGHNPLFNRPGNDFFADIKSDLRARKLKKHLGVTFRATHDIRNHLRLYRKQKVIEIYHYTAFLKEQLRLTKENGDWTSSSTAIRVVALPRQLALEVLESLQMILFPLYDPKSRRLLQYLVSNCLFDHDILHFEFSSIRRVDEEYVPYIYLADRLSELYNELQSPQPRGWLDQQMERKSGARYMMMATLLGVILAILLGIVSLSVTSYQTWIAYQAWQHPVLPSNH